MARNMNRIQILLATCLALFFASCANLSSSARIEHMYVKTTAPTEHDGELSNAEFIQKRRDMDRRAARVRELVEDGKVNGARDEYRAAVILYDSQDIADIVLAQELAMRAHENGTKDGMRIVAHCMDRSLMMRSKPQHFGTQVVYEAVLSKWRLYDLDPSTTDEDRAAFGIQPLSELQDRVGYLNERR